MSQQSRSEKRRQYWQGNWRRIFGNWALALGCLGFLITPFLFSDNEPSENDGQAEIQKVVQHETSEMKASPESTAVRYPRSRKTEGVPVELAQQ